MPSTTSSSAEDYYCVPRFVLEALQELTGAAPTLELVSRRLGVHLPRAMANPFGLVITDDPSDFGVTIARAESNVPALLRDCSAGLRFRHIAFDAVTLRLYGELLEEATERGAVVAVGYNARRLPGRPGLARHVARIRPAEDDRFARLTGSNDDGSCDTWEWARVEEAVLEVSGGFWMMGSEDALSLSLALPWLLSIGD